MQSCTWPAHAMLALVDTESDVRYLDKISAKASLTTYSHLLHFNASRHAASINRNRDKEIAGSTGIADIID